MRMVVLYGFQIGDQILATTSALTFEFRERIGNLLIECIWSGLEFLAFCYREGRGAPPPDNDSPPKGVCPAKILGKTIERTIETIAYCFKNNGLLSFANLAYRIHLV